MKARSELRGIYAITDPERTPGPQLFSAAELALRGGIRLLQYRDKTATPAQRFERARELHTLCTRYRVPLIINDDIRLAKKIGAAGVHLGNHDSALTEARALLGADAIIGISCYNRLPLAVSAEAAGADYVAFGSVYASPTKPQAAQAPLSLFEQAKDALSVPVCAIGGIDASNAPALLERGVDLIAVISGIFAQNDIESAARRMVECLDIYKRNAKGKFNS